MKTVELKHEIYDSNGKTIKKGKIDINGIEDPIYLNMQFCIEKEQYQKLLTLCDEFKFKSIHHAMQTLIEESDPEQIVNLAAN